MQLKTLCAMQVSVLPRCSSVSAVLDAHSLSEALQVSLGIALIAVQYIKPCQHLGIAVFAASMPLISVLLCVAVGRYCLHASS